MNAYDLLLTLAPKGVYVRDKGLVFKRTDVGADNERFVITLYDEPVMELDRSGAYTLLQPSQLDPITCRMIQLALYTQYIKHHPKGYIWVGANRTNKRNARQSMRVTWREIGGAMVSVPYTAGLRIRDMRVLNPHICVDYMRRVDRGVVNEVSRRIKFFTQYLKGAAGMGGILPIDWQPNRHADDEEHPAMALEQSLRRLLNETDYSDPRYEDAVALVKLGKLSLRYAWRTKHNEANIVKAGLKKLRENMYEHEGAYKYVAVPFTQGAD